MLSRKTWLVLAVLFAVWAVWHSLQPFDFVYSERRTDDAIYVSKVTCGRAPAIIFLGEFDEDVPGPATAGDCIRLARTRLLEAGGLLVLAAGLVYAGFRFGADPPAPIHQELKPLPKMERSVEGRPPRK